jgi:serine/threonine protein kinase
LSLSITNLTQLEAFYISNNLISGPIPDELNWIKRVNIIKDITHVISYIHRECTPIIVHRDISSNNILLNSKLEAFISDFGTTKLLDPDSSNQTIVVGTYGYITLGLFCYYTFYLPISPLLFKRVVLQTTISQ